MWVSERPIRNKKKSRKQEPPCSRHPADMSDQSFDTGKEFEGKELKQHLREMGVALSVKGWILEMR